MKTPRSPTVVVRAAAARDADAAIDLEAPANLPVHADPDRIRASDDGNRRVRAVPAYLNV